MSKRARKTFFEADPNEIGEVTPEMKQKLAESGLKPYFSNEGKLYWLNKEQLAYKQVKANGNKHITLFPKKRGNRRRKRRHTFIYRYFTAHWMTIVFSTLALLLIIFFREIVSLFQF